MKSLNNSKELWSNMSVKEIENSNYNSACCLNARVNSDIQSGAEGNSKKVTERSETR
jgi:hypothetical protein